MTTKTPASICRVCKLSFHSPLLDVHNCMLIICHHPTPHPHILLGTRYYGIAYIIISMTELSCHVKTVMSCYVWAIMSCLSCHVMSWHAMTELPCHVMACHDWAVMSCHVMPYPVWAVMSCHVMSWLSCHMMWCHVMSCRVMSCRVLSWLSWLSHAVTSAYIDLSGNVI